MFLVGNIQRKKTEICEIIKLNNRIIIIIKNKIKLKIIIK